LRQPDFKNPLNRAWLGVDPAGQQVQVVPANGIKLRRTRLLQGHQDCADLRGLRHRQILTFAVINLTH
jgi:hypothetical protein